MGTWRIGALAIVCCIALVPDVATDPLSSRGPALAVGPPHFAEETSSAGIDHVYSGNFEYAAGGGVAAFDCNGDGKPDIYLPGGIGSAALYRNDSSIGGTLRFTRLRVPATDLGHSTGAYPIDIDGDGITHLVVLRNGENVLLRGLRGCPCGTRDGARGRHPGA